NKPLTKELKPAIRQFRASLARSQYKFDSQDVSAEQVAVTPLVGIGKRRNRLNQGINQLVAQAKDEIFICTPYFNFPPSLAKEVKKALK
ncbi:CDP-diacylglycerol--serine O-phosphatidyltransferase, partial [Vibrio breoganii]